MRVRPLISSMAKNEKRDVGKCIDRICLHKGDLAEMADLSHDYVRQLSRKTDRRSAGPKAIAKLRTAVETQIELLTRLLDEELS